MIVLVVGVILLMIPALLSIAVIVDDYILLHNLFGIFVTHYFFVSIYKDEYC